MTTDHLYLAHHGIKGMKWGVRRFQNPDGSYTEAGKKRYSDGESSREIGRREDAMGYKYNKPNESGWIGAGRAIKAQVTKAHQARQEKKEAKEQEKAAKKYEREYRRKWLDSYNRAAGRMNAGTIDKINKKYEQYDFMKDTPENREAFKRYAKELGDAWTSTYSDQLLSDFGEHPTKGRYYIENAPFMDTYVGLDWDDIH